MFAPILVALVHRIVIFYDLGRAFEYALGKFVALEIVVFVYDLAVRVETC